MHLKPNMCAAMCFGAIAALSPIFPGSAVLPGTASGAALAVTVGNGGKARISLSVKLKTLSQETAAAACNINAGFDPEASRIDLARSLGDFKKILAALEVGDDLLGVPSPEGSLKTLAAIQRVHDVWDPYASAAEKILAQSDPVAAQQIAEQNLALLDATDVLASQLTGQYSDPALLLQVDAMAIGIAGRQLMFSQQIRKEACELGSETATDADRKSFVETVDVFERSLNALSNGLPDAGVRPPPNDGIREALGHAQEQWAQVRPVLENLVHDHTGTEAEILRVNEVSHALLLDMNNVVTQYLLAIPGSDDVYRVPLRGFAETQLAAWLEEPALIEILREQNSGNAGMTQSKIDALDKQWRAETNLINQPLIDDLMSRPASVWLQEQQAATAGFVTEVFIMDNVGINAAQSAVTSDYWQGDEAKWQETFGNGSGDIHISEVEFDDSTQVYQSQVSMPVMDPDTHQMIGAITFGVNVQSLL